MLFAATSTRESADAATAYKYNHDQIAAGVRSSQVSPESVETNSASSAEPISTEPSADDAIDVQLVIGAVLWIQVAPASSEWYTGPGGMPLPSAVPRASANKLLPVADEATQTQFVIGAF